MVTQSNPGTRTKSERPDPADSGGTSTCPGLIKYGKTEKIKNQRKKGRRTGKTNGGEKHTWIKRSVSHTAF